MSALRVTFLCHSFPPSSRPLANVGGMQRVGIELARALACDARAELTTIALRSSWRWTHLRVPGFLVQAAWRVARMARGGKVDVVLFSSMVTAGLVLPLRTLLRRCGVKTAVIAHGRDVTLPFRPYQWLVGRVLRTVDIVLPVSRAVADASVERGAPAHRVRVVPNGVDPDRFADPVSREEARGRLTEILGISSRPDRGWFVFLSVGRHVRRKGFGWFLTEVVPRLPGQVLYLVAGEGSETGALRAAARMPGLEDRVRLLGKVSERDLEIFYRAADLLVMPNLETAGEIEGFGVVILEAGICSLPTVSAEIEGMRDVVREGVNGFLVPSGDADTWVARLTRLMSRRDLVETVRKSTRRHTLERFAWPVVVGAYVSALSDLVRPSRHAPRPSLPAAGTSHLTPSTRT